MDVGGDVRFPGATASKSSRQRDKRPPFLRELIVRVPSAMRLFNCGNGERKLKLTAQGERMSIQCLSCKITLHSGRRNCVYRIVGIGL